MLENQTRVSYQVRSRLQDAGGPNDSAESRKSLRGRKVSKGRYNNQEKIEI